MLNKPIGITMGDPAGIGPEMLAKLLVSDTKENFRIFANFSCLEKFSGFNINFNDRRLINVQSIHSVSSVKQGIPSAASGGISYEILQRAVENCLNGNLSALLTCPVSKYAWSLAGHNWPGHTELLAHMANPKNPASVRMLLFGQELNIVLNSTHLSLKDAILGLNTASIVETAEITNLWYKKYIGDCPNILVAGLNPHNGENGLLGTEEIDVLIPAVRKISNLGISVSGPYPADTLFYSCKSNDKIPKRNIILALYHDQALIPFKLNGLDKGVNTTMGLPFIRTSVDHGTGFDIAGKQVASIKPLLASLFLTENILRERKELNENKNL